MRLTLQHLVELGFDNSTAHPAREGYRVACSQCAAVVVNGVPSHERGCRNAVHECAGCDVLIPARERWCGYCTL